MARAVKKETKKTTTKRGKKGNSVTLDFSEVKSFKAIPEGPYLVEVTSVEEGKSQNDNPTLSFEFSIAEGKFQGSKLWHTTALTKEALWKVREVFEALGQEVDGQVTYDLDELVGCTCGVIVYNETYEGKQRAKIGEFLSKDDVDTDEEEEVEEKSSKKSKDKKTSSKKSATSVSDMDEDELQEIIEENGLDVDLDDYSSIKKKRAAVDEAMNGDTDEEEEDDTPETYTEKHINKMDLDQLQELNDDLDLDIDDIEDMKPKAAREAVLKVLKKKKLLAK